MPSRSFVLISAKTFRQITDNVMEEVDLIKKKKIKML